MPLGKSPIVQPSQQKLIPKEEGFLDKLKSNNPFKRIMEGLEKIDEMKRTGVLDQMRNENFFKEPDPSTEQILNEEDSQQ